MLLEMGAYKCWPPLGVIYVGPPFTAQLIVGTGPTYGEPKCRVQTQNLGGRNRPCEGLGPLAITSSTLSQARSLKG